MNTQEPFLFTKRQEVIEKEIISYFLLIRHGPRRKWHPQSSVAERMPLKFYQQTAKKYKGRPHRSTRPTILLLLVFVDMRTCLLSRFLATNEGI
jgi:hypothetical protein